MIDSVFISNVLLGVFVYSMIGTIVCGFCSVKFYSSFAVYSFALLWPIFLPLLLIYYVYKGLFFIGAIVGGE